MARVELTINSTSRDGLNSGTAMVAADSINGMYLQNSQQNAIVRVLNSSGVSINVTFGTNYTVDSVVLPDKIIAIPAGEERMFGPFRNATYGNNTTRNELWIDFSASASVTIGAFKLGDL